MLPLAVLSLAGVLYAGQVNAGVCPANTVPDGKNLVKNGDFLQQPAGPYPIAPKTDLGGWTADVPFSGIGYAADTTVTIAIGTVTDGFAVNQIPFPGDPANKVKATPAWLYSNGNDKATSRVIWRQTVTGLTAGKDYVFSGYYSNAIQADSKDKYNEPVMNIGVDGKSLGTIKVLNHSDLLSGDGGKDVWKRFEFKVTPTKTSAVLTIADDFVNSISGDDLGITALSIESCKSVLSGPDIAADKTALSFTGVVAATSAAQVITVTNKGQLDLNITKVSLAGLNPADYVISKNTCTAAVKPKGTCTVDVQFKPSVIGSRVAEVQIASNDADTPVLKVPLQGVASAVPAGSIAVTPLAIAFPITETGKSSASQNITVSNTGGADITITDVKVTDKTKDFVVDAKACAKGTKLKPKATCVIKASFKPTSVGSKNATVSVLSDDKQRPTVDIALSGVASPSAVGDIALASADILTKGLPFGELLIQTTSKPKTITIKNEGGAPLTITDIQVANTQFTADKTACTAAPIAAGKSCDVAVTFAPTAVGPQTGILSIISNDADESPLSVVLTGTGLKDDKDSDGDGLSDETELRLCGGVAGGDIDGDGLTDGPLDPDTDGDGIVDGKEDVNKNGRTDRDVTTGTFLETDPCVKDTDGDGIDDGKEDANKDGKVEKDGGVFKETDPRVVDTDGDGLNDGVEDANRNGVYDKPSETDPRIVDTDGDGLRDGLEDANRNGVYDKPAETDPRVVDTDGDGVDDGVEDANHNGIVDAGETDPRVAAQKAVAGDAGSTPGPVLTDLEGGVGGGAAGLPFLSLLGGGLLFRRRKVAAVVAATVAGAALVAAPVQAKEGQFYIGAGIGQSFIDPDPDTNNTGYKVDDDTDFGGKIFLGYDLLDFWSIEGFYADMGAAAMSHATKLDGEIDYQSYGLETLLHLPNTKPGFSGFLKLGFGKVKTDSDNIPFEDVEDSQLFGGVGLEYQFESTVSLRGEYQYFDEDAQLITLNVIKRFGGEPNREPVVVVEEPKDTDGDGVLDEKDQCPGTPAGTRVDIKGCAIDSDNDGIVDTRDKCPNSPAGVRVDSTGCQFIVEVEIDSDSDGVLDRYDNCPETEQGIRVDSKGCPFVTQEIVQKFSGVLEGVNFHTNSDRLTGEAKSILNGVAQELLEYPDVNIVIVGHTDNVGRADHNKALSLARAKSVARYLASRGVDRNRMKYAGKGEEEPIASNATSYGRAKNRRVEIVVEQYGSPYLSQ
jgi:OOP family OmpA-OmpF porin